MALVHDLPTASDWAYQLLLACQRAQVKLPDTCFYYLIGASFRSRQPRALSRSGRDEILLGLALRVIWG